MMLKAETLYTKSLKIPLLQKEMKILTEMLLILELQKLQKLKVGKKDIETPPDPENPGNPANSAGKTGDGAENKTGETPSGNPNNNSEDSNEIVSNAINIQVDQYWGLSEVYRNKIKEGLLSLFDTSVENGQVLYTLKENTLTEDQLTLLSYTNSDMDKAILKGLTEADSNTIKILQNKYKDDSEMTDEIARKVGIPEEAWKKGLDIYNDVKGLNIFTDHAITKLKQSDYFTKNNIMGIIKTFNYYSPDENIIEFLNNENKTRTSQMQVIPETLLKLAEDYSLTDDDSYITLNDKVINYKYTKYARKKIDNPTSPEQQTISAKEIDELMLDLIAKIENAQKNSETDNTR